MQRTLAPISRLDQPFTEKEEDLETRLTYFGARYLDAELGSWTAADPMRQYHNGYSFVGGNPINFVDPWGLEGEDNGGGDWDESVWDFFQDRGGTWSESRSQPPSQPADASNVTAFEMVRFSEPPKIQMSAERGNYIPDEFEEGRNNGGIQASVAAAKNAPDAIVTAATMTPWGLPEGMLLRMGRIGRWLLRAGESSRIVPGGGLMGHEVAGGHLIVKHVGKTTAELASRLAAEKGIPAASTFLTRAEAEAAVSAVIDINATKIANWEIAGAKGRLAVSARLRTGMVLQRGAAHTTTGSEVTVVLRGTGGGSWKILTGYPTP